MAKEKKQKEYKKASDIDKSYKRKVLDLKEFALLDIKEQNPKIKSILDEMYEEKLEVTNKHIDKVLNVAFDVGDNVVYLPESLKVEKIGSKLIFEFAHRGKAFLILLFLLGFLFIGGAATYAGIQYLAMQSLNIDLNGDKIPDLNIDLDDDGICDVNCDIDKDKKPDRNVDYLGDHKSHFNVLMEDGSIRNPLNQDVDNDGVCDINCDTNDDGWPDLNVDLDGDGKIDTFIDTNGDKNPDLNLDTDGDGKPDVNVDFNGDGKCDVNCVDKQTNDFNKQVDKDLDGDGVCDVNCDTNQDGIPDTNVDYNGNNKPTFNKEDENGNKSNLVDQDTNGDGKCDLNCDIDKDGWPDTNVDLDGDGKPDVNLDINDDGNADLNIDGNNDGEPDLNIDTNGDGYCDLKCVSSQPTELNQDIDGDGKCDINCDINNDDIPDLNIDTNGDGIPDLNIDDDGDNKCDRNCAEVVKPNLGNGNVDQQGGNQSGGTTASLYVLFDGENQVITENLYPDDQEGEGVNTVVEPLNFTITNLTDLTLYYDISWIDIENTFESENFWYKVTSDKGYNEEFITAPKTDKTFATRIAIKPKETHSYTINLTLHGINAEQNIDQGKTFKGKIKVDIASEN